MSKSKIFKIVGVAGAAIVIGALLGTGVGLIAGIGAGLIVGTVALGFSLGAGAIVVADSSQENSEFSEDEIQDLKNMADELKDIRGEHVSANSKVSEIRDNNKDKKSQLTVNISHNHLVKTNSYHSVISSPGTSLEHKESKQTTIQNNGGSNINNVESEGNKNNTGTSIGNLM